MRRDAYGRNLGKTKRGHRDVSGKIGGKDGKPWKKSQGGMRLQRNKGKPRWPLCGSRIDVSKTDFPSLALKKNQKNKEGYVKRRDPRE